MKKDIITMCIILASLLTACNNGIDNTSTTNNNIEVYSAFGNEKHIIVEGRAVNKSTQSVVSENDSGYTNAWSTLNFFRNNELKNKKVFLAIGKEMYETRSDKEGYFKFDTSLLTKLSLSAYIDTYLHIENNKNRSYTQAIILSSEKEMVGIISDIDDTVVVSDVTNKTELLLNTFWKNYKQREVIPTMVERFHKILAAHPPRQPSRLFFISGSPKQLFTPIEKFLAYNHFPKHILILKQIQGSDKDPLLDQQVYKTKKIEALIALYPHMKWIMFGDNGEKDLETYSSIKEKYPSKIKAYYIRNVETGEIVLYD